MGNVLTAAAALLSMLLVVSGCSRKPEAPASGFVGSASCRGCHEQFYELWAPSHHGLAMQPYTPELAAAEFTPHAEDIVIGEYRYRMDVTGQRGQVIEKGPDGEKRYPIEHVMGGKNVYYFLTPYIRGRLQTLPIAYDVREKIWFDTAASGVRHFPDVEDAPIHWTDRPYTFNTSCYGCHVSQLTINYNLENDEYDTTWSEPGINCETCHGPAGEHVRFCEEDEEACKEDPRIIVTSDFTVEQNNSNCAPCHAKMIPISDDFRPGDRYFDHYDLVTLEHRDFYPDGRDLGENYTYTTWRMSPCVKSGQLDCTYCHTSSGRYRFAGEKTNDACAPCHFDKVNNPTAHTRHPEGSPGNQCVSCHMPMTDFARMARSDHSMRPPAPAATIAFESPNACNICHTDQSAQWADRLVRQWRERDYQQPILEQGRLVQAARNSDWSRLRDIGEYVTSPGRDEIVATSLIRLLRNCEDSRKWEILYQTVKDSSPLVRAASAEALLGNPAPEAITALVNAARDDFRLVRIRAASALAGTPLRGVSAEDRAVVQKATDEFLASMQTRPDDESARTNLGNFYMNNGQLAEAIAAYETALTLNPMSVATAVNLSVAYNLNGENEKAEKCLRLALETDPKNAAVNFNLGLLLGEMNRKDEARTALRTALEGDPQMAQAAYNLCVLEAERSPSQAVRYCRMAAELRPDDARYAYTLGFYQFQSRDTFGAVQTLEGVITRHPSYMDAYSLLSQVYRAQGNMEAAATVAARARQAAP